MKVKTTTVSIATITIYGAGKMSARGRSQIAAWMRRNADDLEKLGDGYTDKRFTARYFVELTKEVFLSLPMSVRNKVLRSQCTPRIVKHYEKIAKEL